MKLIVLLLSIWIIGATRVTWGDTNRVTLYMIGDSTMANKPVMPPNAERGWGQLMPLYFKESVRVENAAVNGRTAKSFISEGRWKTVLERLEPGDYVLIQFGHNDQKDKSPSGGAFGHYPKYLQRYVKETRERGAIPILATSIVRRRFDKAGKFFDTLGDYPKAMRQVAEELSVPLLELHNRTAEMVERLGPERSSKVYNHLLPGEYAGQSDALRDDTHLNAFGASRVCDLAVEEIVAKVPALAAHLKR